MKLRTRVEEWRQRWNAGNGPKFLALARPEIGAPTSRYRAIAEPVIATLFFGVLTALVGLAGASLLTFVLASALVFLVLTKVFGIHLEAPVMGR